MRYLTAVVRQWFGGYVDVIYRLQIDIEIHLRAFSDVLHLVQWFVASIFILIVGMAMAELASAAPTSGGVRFSLLPSPSAKFRTILGVGAPFLCMVHIAA